MGKFFCIRSTFYTVEAHFTYQIEINSYLKKKITIQGYKDILSFGFLPFLSTNSHHL